MPTLTVTHEAPLELIRQHPSLAAELVRATLSIPLPPDLEARLGPTDLNNVVPAEFTADSVVTLHDPGTGEPVLVVIIEPQGRADVDKQYAWPAYITNVRRAARCPRAVLVVICPDPVEGEKCRKGIPTGHPGFDLRPIVIDPLHAPSIEGASSWLVIFDACLGVLELGTEPSARLVLNAVHDSGASAADRERLITLILKAAPAAARQILEDLMATTEWKSDFVESFVNVGIEKGREQGIVEGAIRAKAEAILKILDARDLKPTNDQRGQVNAATDLAQLDRWFDRALTAATAAEIFTD
jgi:plasmid stabilization system protein ParE